MAYAVTCGARVAAGCSPGPARHTPGAYQYGRNCSALERPHARTGLRAVHAIPASGAAVWTVSLGLAAPPWRRASSREEPFAERQSRVCRRAVWNVAGGQGASSGGDVAAGADRVPSTHKHPPRQCHRRQPADANLGGAAGRQRDRSPCQRQGRRAGTRAAPSPLHTPAPLPLVLSACLISCSGRTSLSTSLPLCSCTRGCSDASAGSSAVRIAAVGDVLLGGAAGHVLCADSVLRNFVAHGAYVGVASSGLWCTWCAASRQC